MILTIVMILKGRIPEFPASCPVDATSYAEQKLSGWQRNVRRPTLQEDSAKLICSLGKEREKMRGDISELQQRLLEVANEAAMPVSSASWRRLTIVAVQAGILVLYFFAEEAIMISLC
jgi:hypothetical protein